ncbi:DUF6093 family protein [Streptacidiphilus cavernicola]|uniref:DUF6093 family protein n=1 Tax=Streptacidiphilus cavernicola TaxID=3342716 RepID=A0ABV6VNZ1_9ACTN
MSDTTAEGLTLGAVSDIVKSKVLVDTVQIFQPGPEVLDPDSGEYVPGPDTVIYEGPGAIFAQGGPGITLSLEGQAYVDDTSDRFKLLTPLDAPLASRGDQVRVTVATQDGGLINRVWRVLDLSDAGTLAIVRTTWLDQNTQTAGS